MKLFFFFGRIAMLILLGCAFSGLRAGAQTQIFGLSVSNPPGPIAISNSIPYIITVTNLAGTDVNLYVTSSISSLARIISATPGPVETDGATNVVFLTLLPAGTIGQFSVTAQPFAAGFVTNTVSAIDSAFSTPVVTSNVVIEVTNSAPANTTNTADLAIFALAGPATAIITNDWFVYSVAVTNLGPQDSPDTFLTNALPPGVGLISVTPAGAYSSTAGSNIILNLGTLATGAGTNLALKVQATNAGTLTFSSAVGSVTAIDPNPTNNAAGTNIVVGTFLPGLLTATNVTDMIFVPQTGLMEQTVRVSDVDTNPVVSARVTVFGLTNVLFNASGTNNGNPFVVYANPNNLGAGQSVDLLLKYFNPFGLAITNLQLQANEVPLMNLAPLHLGAQVTNILTNVRLGSGDYLIEFPGVIGQSYTVVYYDDGNSSNLMTALPAITAVANLVQWFDYGPPETITPLTNVSSRTYSVFQNP